MIGVIMADDHPIVREGLKRIIDDCPDIHVVTEAMNGHELLECVGRIQADVVLLDISMPGPPFLETLRQIGAERPSIKTLVLSMHPEDQYAIRSLRAGAAGYLTKDHSPEELPRAIRKVHSGGRYVSATLAEKLALELGKDTNRELHETLSDREYQVFCLIGAGRSVGEIASKLALSPKTVSTYRARILEKTQMRSNAEIIRFAIENGLAVD